MFLELIDKLLDLLQLIEPALVEANNAYYSAVLKRSEYLQIELTSGVVIVVRTYAH